MSETKKQRQFSDILARLDNISAKLDEVLARLAPNERKSPLASEIVGKRENEYTNEPSDLHETPIRRLGYARARVDKNLGTLS